MTAAQESLKTFAAWLGRSSANGRSPMGHVVPRGRYAEIIPVSFDEPPPIDFDPMALPLFVSEEQAEELNLPPVADVGFPEGHLRPSFRLGTIAGRVADSAVAHMVPWHGADGNGMPVMCLVPVLDPAAPLQAAIEAAGATGVDTTAYPVVLAPLWAMSPKERAELLATRLPFLP